MLLQRVLPSNHWEIIWRPKNCEHLINQYIKLSLECLGIPVVLFTLRLRWLRSMGLILRRQNLHICFHACSNLLVFFHIFSRKSKPLSCTTVLYSNSKLFSVLIPSHLLSEMFMAAYQKIGSMTTVVTTRNGSLSMGGGGLPSSGSTCGTREAAELAASWCTGQVVHTLLRPRTGTRFSVILQAEMKCPSK